MEEGCVDGGTGLAEVDDYCVEAGVVEGRVAVGDYGVVNIFVLKGIFENFKILKGKIETKNTKKKKHKGKSKNQKLTILHRLQIVRTHIREHKRLQPLHILLQRIRIHSIQKSQQPLLMLSHRIQHQIQDHLPYQSASAYH